MLKTAEGVLYVVSGDRKYFDEAVFSAKTFRRFNPTIPIAFFSPWPNRARHVSDFSEPNPPSDHPLKAKVLGIMASPFERTLFLDSDTQVRGSLEPVFSLLRTHDVAIANEVLCDWSTPPYRFIDFKNPQSFNTGVIGFSSSPAAKEFLREWSDRTGRQNSKDMWPGHNGDQRYFNLVVKSGFVERSGLKIAVLDNCLYNVRPQLLDPLRKTNRLEQAVIYHFRGGQSRRARLQTRLRGLWRRIVKKASAPTGTLKRGLIPMFGVFTYACSEESASLLDSLLGLSM